jgi:REP element-mobilizing transposase RayT
MFWQRKLPHWVPDDAILFVTWRLAETVPPTQSSPRWLSNPQIAKCVVEAIQHGEQVRKSYDLLAWVVMPNHVHVVIKPHEKLSDIMRWLKSTTAGRANRIIGKPRQPFWQREYFDRWIRSSKELASVISYLEANPVRAGLVPEAEDWPWSSAKLTGDKIAGPTGVDPDKQELRMA